MSKSNLQRWRAGVERNFMDSIRIGISGIFFKKKKKKKRKKREKISLCMFTYLVDNP